MALKTIKQGIGARDFLLLNGGGWLLLKLHAR
jgi:hypothetical protein